MTGNAPQLHSHDARVRLRESEFAEIALTHVESYDDATVMEDAHAAARAGSTEWRGQHAGVALSIAWDWSMTHDGHVRALEAVPPRSNIQLIDGKGYDLSDEEAARGMWRRIGGLDWQAHVTAGRV